MITFSLLTLKLQEIQKLKQLQIIQLQEIEICVWLFTTLSVSKSRWSVDNTSAIIAAFVRMTPFGSPVVPLVYIIVQMSVFCFGGSSSFELPWNQVGWHQIDWLVKINVDSNKHSLYRWTMWIDILPTQKTPSRKSKKPPILQLLSFVCLKYLKSWQ